MVHPSIAGVQRRSTEAVGQRIQEGAAGMVRRRTVAVQHSGQGGVPRRAFLGVQPLQDV